MQPVQCSVCEAVVEARKSSWDQTTVQWTADALARCVERQQQPAPSDRPNRHAFTGCVALKESVRAAAVSGDLVIQDVDPLKTNPEARR